MELGGRQSNSHILYTVSMPKPSTDTIDAAHIRQILAANSDFVFEISVLKALRKLALTCRHGGTYEDPVTGKTRQFDIQAEAGRIDRSDPLVRFRFAVECKNIGRNFPLVVHRLPRDASEAYLDVVVATRPSPGMLLDYSKRLTLANDGSPYAVADRVGKAFDQIGRTAGGDVFSSDQDVFEKMTQALNSSKHLLEQSHYAATPTEPVLFSIVVPVLVVPSGSLWVVDYDDDGNVIDGPTVQLVASTFVGKEWLVGGKLGRSFTLSHIEIVTFDALFIICLGLAR